MNQPSAKKSLEQTLSRATLKLLAGSRTFHRGEAYFEEELVQTLAIDHDRATASVHGTRTYRTKLWVRGESVQGECTCPAFEDMDFCKHMIAVGLAIITPPPTPQGPHIRNEVRRKKRKTSYSEISIENVREYLSKLSHKKLIKMLMDQVMDNPALLRQLHVEILRNRSLSIKDENPREVINSLKQAIDQGTDIDGFYEWENEYAAAEPLESIFKRIKTLLKTGLAPDVIEITEYFLAAIEEIIERFHEGFYLGELLEKLQKLHLSACQAAKPDPENLANRLFQWELTSEWNVFKEAAKTYSAILGKRGLDVFRKLATAEWEKVPEKKETSVYSRSANDHPQRYQLTKIMETLAGLKKDVDSLAAVKAKDLSSGYQYLTIAQLYATHKQYDKALNWAEKGLKAFPKQPDGRLREFVANEYHRLKRHDRAMALIWAEFTKHPALDRYKLLRTHATRIKTWTHWRTKALDHLRTLEQKFRKSSRSSHYWGNPDYSSTLVEIFLWEKDIEAAWKQAHDGKASEGLWYQLAKMREKTHPKEVIPIYQRLVTETLSEANNDAYREAIKLIEKIRKLMKETEQTDAFTAFLQKIRATHKPKRNFIKLLDAKY